MGGGRNGGSHMGATKAAMQAQDERDERMRDLAPEMFAVLKEYLRQHKSDPKACFACVRAATDTIAKIEGEP